MVDPRKDPTRRCIRLDEWPAPHRLAWQAAIRSGDPFTRIGLAAHWRAGTINKVASSYGRWLTFLHVQGVLDSTSGPLSYTKTHLFQTYVTELQGQVASITVAQRITDLHEALRVIAPGADIAVLHQAVQVLTAQAKPSRDKRVTYVPPHRVLQLAIDIMTEADQGSFNDDIARAIHYRNGLMLTILVARAPRRRNFAAIQIGANLERVGNEFVLRFSGAETKNGRPWESTLPESFSPMIDRYLQHHRPVLLSSRGSTYLWIAAKRTSMAEISIYNTIRELTRERLGVAMNLHSFRNGPPTALAIEDPLHVGAASPILGHSYGKTAEASYNQATGVEARRQHQAEICRLREDALKRKKSQRRGQPDQAPRSF